MRDYLSWSEKQFKRIVLPSKLRLHWARGKSNLKGFYTRRKNYPGTELSKNSADRALRRVPSIKQCLRSLRRVCCAGAGLVEQLQGSFIEILAWRVYSDSLLFLLLLFILNRPRRWQTCQTDLTGFWQTDRRRCSEQFALVMMTVARYSLDTANFFFSPQTQLIESTLALKKKKKKRRKTDGDPTNWSVKLSVRLLTRTVGGQISFYRC